MSLESSLLQFKELKVKSQKDVENLQKLLEEAEAVRDRSERAKKKFQQDVCIMYFYAWFYLNQFLRNSKI